jgi:hypothetical protein
MSNEIRLAGDGTHISLEVRGYERKLAESLDDANWLACIGSIHAGAFRGEVDCAVTTHELRRFANSLQEFVDSIEQVADFLPLEEGICLKITAQKSGKCTVEASVMSPSHPQAALKVTFESEITAIEQTISMLNRVLLHFPEVHSVS